MALKPISRIAAGVQASTTLAIDSLFKQMKAEGKDVVGFGAGEPDFPTPEHIKQAGIEAIENNQTKYTPAAGLMDLRKAACYRLKEDCGLDYEPTQIVVASGAKHSVYIALMALCNPGDEVVIAAPYWVSYSEMVKQAGAVPVIVAATEEADFKITAEQLDAAITDNTKVFMLNSPSNPTGMVYTRAELEAIAEVCCRRNVYVIADEIYCNLVYDNNEFVSFASLSEDAKNRTILVNGVSKSYAMTGWRIGYSASNPALAKVMANYLSAEHHLSARGHHCADRPAGGYAGHEGSVREAPRPSCRAHEQDRGRFLHQAGGRVLCHDEHDRLYRQDHVRQGHRVRRGLLSAVPGKGPGCDRTVHRVCGSGLCPLELRDLADRDRQGSRPSGSVH